MKKIIKNIILISGLFIYQIANGQNSYLSFSHIGLEQGLSDTKINAIVQDELGFMWVATDFGLNRYDGHHFFYYKNEANNVNSLSSNIISCLFIDSVGNIWIGTDKGLNLYEYSSGKIFRFEKAAFANSKINAIESDSDNNLLIATNKQGLFIANITDIINSKRKNYDTNFKQLNVSNGLSDNNIRTLHKDKKNNLWLGTDKGLNFYNNINIPLNSVTINRKVYDFFKNKKITSISSSLIKNDEIIWVGTSSGLYYFKTNNTLTPTYFDEKTKGFSSSYITKVISQNDTTIWIGSLWGLRKINTTNNKIDKYFSAEDDNQSISSSIITTLYVDIAGLLWVGSGNQGLNYANTQKNQFSNYIFKNYLPENEINATAIIEDSEKNLLIAVSEGILKYDIKNDSLLYLVLTKIDIANRKGITNKILIDKGGNIWMSNYGKGLLLYDKNFKLKKTYTHNSEIYNSLSDNYVYTIFFDSDYNLYVGTRKGMNVLNKQTGLFDIYYSKDNKPNTLNNRFITAFAESKQSIIYIGTWGGGVFVFNQTENSFTNIRFDKSESHQSMGNSINKMLFENDSILWLATANGLKKYNVFTKKTENFTKENGLPSRNVNDIILKGNELWITTDLGISVINTKTRKLVNYKRLKNIFIGGLLRQSGLLHSNGAVFFGGAKGFVRVNSENSLTATLHYKTFISDFFIFDKSIGTESGVDKPVYILDTINISTSDKLIRFELTTPCYLYTESICYKYKLQGLSDDFIELNKTEHSIGFSNLEYGEYSLIIMSSAKEGVWSKEQKVVTLIVEPRVWQTIWFKILFVFFVVLLIYLIYQWRLINIRKHNQKLELLVKQKTAELKNSLNTLIVQKEELSEVNVQLEEKQEEISQQAEEVLNISEQLRESNITLEKKVKSRTKELKIALEKAEDSQRLISSFLQNMSHEVRTPINAISGFSQLIAQQFLSPKKTAEYAEIIIQKVDSLLELINNIMDASKLHAGQYKFVNTGFILNDVFNIVYKKLKVEREKKIDNVKCTLDLAAGDDLIVYCDKNAFIQLIYNLSENALKYTEKGNVKFGYKLNSIKPENTKNKSKKPYKINTENPDIKLEIYARDTGLGISKKEQEIIFNLFQKLDSNKGKLFRGSGLGLAIVNDLAKKFQAEIKLDSKVGVGTYISVTIPLSKM